MKPVIICPGVGFGAARMIEMTSISGLEIAEAKKILTSRAAYMSLIFSIIASLNDAGTAMWI
jgi:hypothetical protein